MDYAPPRRSNAGFWFGIVLVVLILVGTACLVFWFYKDEVLPEKSQVSPKFVINMRSLSDHRDISINTSYVLLNGAQVVQEGTIYADRVEQFINADNVTAYTLKGRADGHYEGSTTCQYPDDCELFLQKIGNYITQIMPFEDHQAVIIKVVGGSFRDVLVCIQMSWGVEDVVLRNKDVLETIPSRLWSYCDKIYSIGDLEEDKYYVLEFSWTLESEQDKGIDIWLVDDGGSGCAYCSEDYEFALNT